MVKNKIYGPKPLTNREARAILEIYADFYLYPLEHVMDSCCAFMNYECDGLAALDECIDAVHAGIKHPRLLLKHSRLTEIH